MVPSPLPRVGELVAGKYRIESVIGEGGMGVVLGAVDATLNRPVAIKFLTPARAASEAAAERFRREARAAASIQSEHVVRVHEVDSLPNGALFIVMEHLHGSDLAHVLEARGGLPVDEAADLVIQACEALGEAHARGIVHRDLKPQNLCLTRRNDGSPCLKVLDFGIATSAEADASAPKLTRTDMVMGTPLYMSPEQVRSLKEVDARADIWALGAILHELLTASPPFDGPTASALHAAIAMDPPADLRARRPDVPVALAAVVARCLEKKPADRFPDVSALSAALAPFASERGRTSASRVDLVVRASSTSASSQGSSPAVAPAASAPTVPLGVASTMQASSGGRQATDGAWEQSSAPEVSAAAPSPSPAPPLSRLRAGAVAASVLLVGGAGLLFVAWRTPVPKAPTTASPIVSAPVVVTSRPEAERASAVTPVVSVSAAPSPSPTDGGAPLAKVKPPSVLSAAPTPSAPSTSKAGDKMEASCRGSWERLKLAVVPEQRAREMSMMHSHHCKGAIYTPCQKQVCPQVCQVVGDQDCQRRLLHTP